MEPLKGFIQGKFYNQFTFKNPSDCSVELNVNGARVGGRRREEAADVILMRVHIQGGGQAAVMTKGRNPQIQEAITKSKWTGLVIDWGWDLFQAFLPHVEVSPYRNSVIFCAYDTLILFT